MSENKPVVTETMVLLMRYAKDPSIQEFKLDDLKKILGPEYSIHMRTRDVMSVVVRTYLDMIRIPEFEIPYRGDLFTVVFNLIMAPVDNHSYEMLKGEIKASDHRLTFEEYLWEILKKILMDIMLVRCDWCREKLNP